MQSERWQYAIHEAGHIVVARVLGMRTGTAEISAGGGVATCYATMTQLINADDIVVAAAGLAACALLGNEPAPDSEICAVDCTHSEATFASVTTTQFETLESDEQAIARYCIAGCEAYPGAWIRRWNEIHDRAEKIIEEHRAEVLETARQLFAAGSLAAA